jgi:hypothetical protein
VLGSPGYAEIYMILCLMSHSLSSTQSLRFHLYPSTTHSKTVSCCLLLRIIRLPQHYMPDSQPRATPDQEILLTPTSGKKRLVRDRVWNRWWGRALHRDPWQWRNLWRCARRQREGVKPTNVLPTRKQQTLRFLVTPSHPTCTLNPHRCEPSSNQPEADGEWEEETQRCGLCAGRR